MVRILPYGPNALLVETEVTTLAVEVKALPGVTDVVVGACTILVTFSLGERSEREAIAHYTERITSLALQHHEPTNEARNHIRIPVRYDGEDLSDIAEQTGLSPERIIELHTGAQYRVAFMGFAPGFGYLQGLDPTLQLPRLTRPRTKVPAGSVAIAGPYSAVYPRESPGGWLLLGTTELAMFDLHRESPVLLQPGSLVTFEAQ